MDLMTQIVNRRAYGIKQLSSLNGTLGVNAAEKDTQYGDQVDSISGANSSSVGGQSR